jgi:sulfite dehydrogenase (quinone) subunit SoeA
LRRKAGAERGESQFEEITWDEAFVAGGAPGRIRSEDPKRFALFTGRDQMQALTGLFAKQFGTPNYAAHGGFCSVNMAAGLIYTIGGSFWEFGGPDLDRAKLFVMIGTAEDHHSNPLKIAISKLKRRGGRFVSINPIRTGYSAIADEWVPIKPGTDGALLLAIIHEIIKLGLYDRDFLSSTPTPPSWWWTTRPGRPRPLPPLRDARGGGLLRPGEQALVGPGDRPHRAPIPRGPSRACSAATAGGRHAGQAGLPAPQGAGRGVHPRVGRRDHRDPGETIRRLAHEMGVTARDQKIELPIPWTDCWDNEHDSVTGNPVAFHAMRGLAAHSNGFQTIRALAS